MTTLFVSRHPGARDWAADRWRSLLVSAAHQCMRAVSGGPPSGLPEYETRNKAIHPRSDEYQRYCLLRDLRNHLAHGNASPQAEIQKALASAEQLQDFLDDLFEQLLPHDVAP